MITYARLAGTADVSVVIRIIDSTDGTPETGVAYNTSGIDLQYRREGATSTAITEATLAGLDSAHSDGGFLHIGNGYYRLDLPDAACAAGAAGVLVHGTVTGMVVIGCYIQLVAYNPFDSVRLGLTALPNAAAEAAGGLYTRGTGAGQIAQDANGNIRANVDTIKTQTVTCAGGVTIPAATLASTTNITAASGVTLAATTGLGNQTANITGNLSGSVGSVTGAVGSVTGDVGGKVLGGGAGTITGTGVTAQLAANQDVRNVSGTCATVTTLTNAPSDSSGVTTLLGRVVGTVAAGTHTAQSGDAYARLGAPAGASVSADVAAVKTAVDTVDDLLDTEVAAILADTNELQTDLVDGGRLDLLIDAIKAKTDSLTFTTPNVVDASATATVDNAAIADAVWDEALAGHAGVGSAGEALSAAGTAGDPWITALPGAYGDGTAWNIIGNVMGKLKTIIALVLGK